MSGLPIIDQKLYKHKLHGLGKTVQYRPFTNKEQKILLMAAEESETSNKYDAIAQIITNCTLGKVAVEKLAMFDLLDLFIRIRQVSVGEKINLQLSVDDPETGKTKFYSSEVDLNQVKVEVPEGHTDTFMLNETYGIKMRYPTFEMSMDVNEESIIADRDIILNCIEYVYDKDGNVFDSFTKEELEAFYDSLDFMMNAKIINFFKTLPDIQVEVEVETENGEKLKKIVKGIDGFFPY